MTDSINVVATVEIEGIEVDDEIVHQHLEKKLTQDKIDMETLVALTMGNFMEIGVRNAKIVGL